MKWKEKIKKWLEGDYQKYPSSINQSFFYETSPITRTMNSKYEDKYIENKYLSKMEEDNSPFKKEIMKSKNKNVTSFFNLSKDAYLIVPIPPKK